MIIWVVKVFLYSSYEYFCHLFLVLSASVKSIPFLSFIVPIFGWNVPWVSQIFFERALIFPILLKLLAYSSSLLVATLFHWEVNSKVRRKLTYNLQKFNVEECFEIISWVSISPAWREYMEQRPYSCNEWTLSCNGSEWSPRICPGLWCSVICAENHILVFCILGPCYL